MKKIGVLTLPLKGNYGGVLQAYALITFLKKNRYDAYLVDRQWNQESNSIPYFIKKLIYHHVIIRNVKKFTTKWINPKTFKISCQTEMQKLNKEDFYAFVVGSDQVWRAEHTLAGVGNNYFLDFITHKDIKKISYAASFGKDSIDGDKNELSQISNLLKQFNSISVREESGVKICSEILNVEAEHVLDPVLLLHRDDYLPIIKKTIPKLKNTLTKYVLDSSNINNEIIKDISKSLGLKIESINYNKDPKFLHKNKPLDFYNYMYPSVSSWLRGFRDADFIVTDSFHGTLFSIIFNKQFLVIGNERRGLARFNSILSKLGLIDRLITNDKPYNSSILKNEIDFNKVNAILDKEKKYSMRFLLNSLQ